MTTTVLTDEQIEDAAWDNRMENSRAEISAKAFKYARAIEQAVLQSPEIRALRKDAERYRWMQDRYKDVPGMIDSGAIDAAMENQK